MIRNERQIGFADLQIVAEHIVKANFQILDAGFLFFFCFDACKNRLCIVNDLIILIQLSMIALLDHTAITNKGRWIINDGILNQLAKIFQTVDLTINFFQINR